MQRMKISLCLVAISLLLNSCSTTGGNTPVTKRQAILDMREKVLSELYKEHPQARTEIASAPGYAVFSNWNVYLFFVSGGSGYGVAKDNRTGKNTFMKMGELGVGLGLGLTDFRAVFIFNKRSVMEQFVNKGWEFGAEAEAAAKSSQQGYGGGGQVVISDITIYQLTQSGLALQATVQGTKYWKDDDLN
ncbi:MAG TPA: YSC84-related protein [Burkholderiales bacterium]|nr:YSC84-related protein [Burkholderiales bacterium]